MKSKTEPRPLTVHDIALDEWKFISAFRKLSPADKVAYAQWLKQLVKEAREAGAKSRH